MFWAFLALAILGAILVIASFYLPARRRGVAPAENLTGLDRVIEKIIEFIEKLFNTRSPAQATKIIGGIFLLAGLAGMLLMAVGGDDESDDDPTETTVPDTTVTPATTASG
jgi:hypothetical protein